MIRYSRLLKIDQLHLVSPELCCGGCSYLFQWMYIVAVKASNPTFPNRPSVRQHQIASRSTPCCRHITRHTLESGWTRIGPAAEPSSAFPISFLIRPAKRLSDPMTLYPRINTLICQVDTKLVLLMKQPSRSPHPLPPSFYCARSTLAADHGRAGEGAHLPNAQVYCDGRCTCTQSETTTRRAGGDSMGWGCD